MVAPLIIYAIVLGFTAATAAVVACYWPGIVDWLAGSVAVWIGENIGLEEKAAFLEVINVLDKKVTAVRRASKDLVSKTVYLVRSLFVKEENGTYQRKDETYTKNPKNPDKVSVQTKTTEVDWDDIPDDIRGDFIRDKKEPKEIKWLNKEVLVNVMEK